MTPLSLWNAAAAGLSPEEAINILLRWSKYEVPPNVPVSIRDTMGRYGRLKLRPGPAGSLLLEASDEALMTEICSTKAAIPLLGERVNKTSVRVPVGHRGELKQAPTAVGHPVEDLAGYTDGEALQITVRHPTVNGLEWHFRDYQINAIDSFYGCLLYTSDAADE